MSDPVLYSGLVIYRVQKSPEYLLINNSFSGKHWTPLKGQVIGNDKVKSAVREAADIARLSPRELRIEQDYSYQINYVANSPSANGSQVVKRVFYYLAQISDHGRVSLASEGYSYGWFSAMQASEKVIFGNMRTLMKKVDEDVNALIKKRISHLVEKKKIKEEKKSQELKEIESRNENGFMRREIEAEIEREARDIKELRDMRDMRDMRDIRDMRDMRDMRDIRDTNEIGKELRNDARDGKLNRDYQDRNMRDREQMKDSRESNNLFKTRLCETFEREGDCKYGSKCTFAHGENELRLKVDENPLYKTRLCSKFMETGSCPYGDRCSFAHGKPELRNHFPEQSPERRQSPPPLKREERSPTPEAEKEITKNQKNIQSLTRNSFLKSQERNHTQRRSYKANQIDDKKEWLREVELTDEDRKRFNLGNRAEENHKNEKVSLAEEQARKELTEYFLHLHTTEEKIKEVAKRDVRLNFTKLQLYVLLLRSVIRRDKIIESLEENSDVFREFIRGNNDQVDFLKSWTKIYPEISNLETQAFLYVVKWMYETELVNEESFLEWEITTGDSSFKTKIKPFLNWLREE